MKKNRKTAGIYLFIILGIAAIVSLLRSFALITDYDKATGYYRDKLLIGMGDWLVVLGVIFSVTYIFAAKKNKTYVATYHDASSYIPSALVAISSVIVAIELFGNMLKPISSASTALTAANLFSAVLAATCALAFVASCLITGRRNATRAAYQISAVLFFAVYSAFLYFENPMPINAPNRIVDIMAYLSAAIFMLYETRLSLGRDLWRMYTVFGLICSLLCAYSAIPSLVNYFVLGEPSQRSIGETVLTLSLFAFATLRMVRSLNLFEETEAKTVTFIKEAESEKKQASELKEAAEEITEESETAEENDNYTIELSQDDN